MFRIDNQFAGSEIVDGVPSLSRADYQSSISLVIPDVIFDPLINEAVNHGSEP